MVSIELSAPATYTTSELSATMFSYFQLLDLHVRRSEGRSKCHNPNHGVRGQVSCLRGSGSHAVGDGRGAPSDLNSRPKRQLLQHVQWVGNSCSRSSSA